MEQQNRASAGEGDQNQRRRWLPLLLLLFFLALITSSIVGYILGRNAGPAPLGQIVDTILLAPDDKAAETAFHLTGRVAYTDGTPAAGRTLELHSDPITAVTDSKGGFLFSKVPEGSHTVYVQNPDGSLGAKREIQVARHSNTDTVTIDQLDDGKYVIELAIDVRVLEIEIELDADQLYINPDRITYATREGVVTTPSGSASVKDGVIVTPNGSVFLPDGHIVFAGGEKNDPTYIIKKDDTVIVDQPLTTGDAVVAPDGTVTLPDGTVIEPGGQIKTPEGEIKDPGEGGVIVAEQDVRPIGGDNSQSGESETTSEAEDPSEADEPAGPAEPEPKPDPAPAETEPETPGQAESDGSAEVPAPGPTEPSAPDGSSDSGSANPERPTDSDSSNDPSEPTRDQGELHVLNQKKDGNFESWTQNSILDLFYNRTTGQTEKIAPGSSGYYLFQLQNTRKMPLTVTLSIAEEEGVPHVPLKFTLHPQGKNRDGVSGSLELGKVLTLQTVISAKSSEVYELDWEWPYEGNDKLDTAAGSQGGQYTLKLTIHAEEGGQ